MTQNFRFRPRGLRRREKPACIHAAREEREIAPHGHTADEYTEFQRSVNSPPKRKSRKSFHQSFLAILARAGQELLP